MMDKAENGRKHGTFNAGDHVGKHGTEPESDTGHVQQVNYPWSQDKAIAFRIVSYTE
jgi:hypothetical protein